MIDAKDLEALTEKQEQENTVENEIVLKTKDLDKESLEIINSIISEQDKTKTNSLTELFNINQKKKTIVRINKLNELLDTITDQTIERFNKRPDEISNQEILQALKIVQELSEKNQKQLSDPNVAAQPLIQINQQTNEVNLGNPEGLTKESRDKVKNAVASVLASLMNATTTEVQPAVVVDDENEVK